MSDKRETIKVCHITNEKYIAVDDLPGFYLVKTEQVSWDREKGFADFKCILCRKSDEKFFKLEYTEYGCGENDLLESELEEVFPKEKTIIVYE